MYMIFGISRIHIQCYISVAEHNQAQIIGKMVVGIKANETEMVPGNANSFTVIVRCYQIYILRPYTFVTAFLLNCIKSVIVIMWSM